MGTAKAGARLSMAWREYGDMRRPTCILRVIHNSGMVGKGHIAGENIKGKSHFQDVPSVTTSDVLRGRCVQSYSEKLCFFPCKQYSSRGVVQTDYLTLSCLICFLSSHFLKKNAYCQVCFILPFWK